MKHIVKRGERMELYDGRKLYASVYAAVLSVRLPVGTAEVIAQEVVEQVELWLQKKQEITSNDIRKVAHGHLESINHNAAYQYKHHRIIW